MTVRSYFCVTLNKKTVALAMASLLLAACGGGGGSSNSTNQSNIGNNTGSNVGNGAGSNNGGSNTNTGNTNGSNTVANVDVSKNFADVAGIADSVTGLNPAELAAFNMLNTARTQCGFGKLNTHAELQKSADNHANYLIYALTRKNIGYGHQEVKDNNPFYSGVRPADRVKTSANKGVLADSVNYHYNSVVENISVAIFTGYNINSDFDKRAANHGMKNLLAAPYHMAALLEHYYQDMGVSYRRAKMLNNQGAQAVILEFMSGLAAGKNNVAFNGTLHYPCQGIINTAYELTDEKPNPIPNRNLKDNPIGQPIYIQSPYGSTLVVNNYSIKEKKTGKVLNVQMLNKANDSNHVMQSHQAILMPLNALKPNTTYTVSYQAAVNGVQMANKSFDFSTIADQQLKNIR